MITPKWLHVTFTSMAKWVQEVESESGSKVLGGQQCMQILMAKTVTTVT